ncbi:IclR family transcriptional regulator [Actinomadura madurae]|uniref:IclR family transcriptional regulator n=1 Tax=Actinomadura madurae TaxID=1993 RepID=UPI0020D25532|nr:helix-turn-helix domain-containing protein [Actinomadura madurae]MCP9964864.1 helix-turn-helix domain-containing protein [Actinomadura madurae]MCQ0013533.1 helix-turn-helix domain-containing protein [Actinomadura madurae]
MAEQGQSDIQAVSRMAQILRLFGPDAPELSVSEATERLQLNRTTVHRYLTSMTAAACSTAAAGPASYTPGGLIVQLGAFAIGQRRIIQLAPDYLRELTEQTGVTSVLSLWGPSGPVVSLVEEDVVHGTIVTVRVGSQLPLVTAQAVAFLAYLPDQLQVDRLLASLPVAQRAGLIDRIATTREIGLSIYPANRRGISVIAAPVFADSGVCATIAAIGTDRMLPSAPDARAPLAVRETAVTLTKEMGGAWPVSDSEPSD